MSQCCGFVHEACRFDAPLAAEVVEGRAVVLASRRDAARPGEVLAEGLLVWSVGVLAASAGLVVAVSHAPGLLP